MGAADINLQSMGYNVLPDLTSQGIYPFGDPRASVRPFGASPTPSGGSVMSATGGGGSGVGQIDAPALQNFNYSSQSQSYPTYLRNLGEQMAQQKFQTQVNQGLRLGAGPQGYQQALNDRNMSRLNYLGQAGQQELGIQQALAAEVDKRNKDILQQYADQIQQRGQDVGYASSMGTAQLNNQGRSQASGNNSSWIGGSNNPLIHNQPGGNYTDIFGNTTYRGPGGNTSMGGTVFPPSQPQPQTYNSPQFPSTSQYDLPSMDLNWNLE